MSSNATTPKGQREPESRIRIGTGLLSDHPADARTCPYCAGPKNPHLRACESCIRTASLIEDAANGDPGEEGEAEVLRARAERCRTSSDAHGAHVRVWRPSGTPGLSQLQWVRVAPALYMLRAVRDTVRELGAVRRAVLDQATAEHVRPDELAQLLAILTAAGEVAEAEGLITWEGSEA